MELKWDDVRLFLAAMEHGTLSEGARAAGVGQSTMSRRIAEMEEALGVVLFSRGRGGLIPTPAAEALRPHAVAMEEASRQALAAVQGSEATLEGIVRVAVPPGVAVSLMPYAQKELAVRHPGIRLHVLASQFAVDMDRREADIAVRALRPSGDDLTCRRLPDMDLGVFASPSLAASLAPDARPEDIPWVQYGPELLHIEQARLVEQWRGSTPPAFVTDSYLAMRSACRFGLGAMVLPRVEAMMLGLVRLPQVGTDLPAVPWYLVSHTAVRRIPRVAAVLTLLGELVELLVAAQDDPSILDGRGIPRC